MHASQTIAVDIARPRDEVYGFLADPRNYPRWAPVVDGHYSEIAPRVWKAMLPFGERIVRFCPENELGVLDHTEEAVGGEPVVNPMRVVDAAAGCQLIFTFRKREGMTDAEFRSTIEWISADLWAFKSLIEG